MLPVTGRVRHELDERGSRLRSGARCSRTFRWPKATLFDFDSLDFDPEEVQALSSGRFGMANFLLINAGVTHPHRPWLDRLAGGGPMVLPITISMGATGLGKA